MTTRPNIISIAFIGFGELGQRFCRDLVRVPGVTLSAYDLAFDDPATAAARQAIAADIGVRASASAVDACRGADIIVSAVTADCTRDVAAALAGHIAPGQTLLDVNSASPDTKVAAARLIEARGAHYVEGAVMGAVRGPGIAVEILAGGPAAQRTADLLNACGMNLAAVSDTHGKASAIKLCRSIVIKGLEALMVDCARATAHWGVEEPVYESLARTFPGTDWDAIAADMNERVATHGVRRSAEMREAADMVGELGADPSLVAAVAAAQMRGAKKR